jgi:hypothetical protein
MTLLVSEADVREYLALNTTPATSQYTADSIGSNILSAQSALEQATGRYFVPRTFDTVHPWIFTTYNKQNIPLPGFRTITSVTKGGSVLAVNGSYWLRPDAMQTGVFTGMAFRAATDSSFWPGQPGTPYGPWITNPLWFDQAADSPFFPANVGGGIFLTSMPNDLLVEGEAGYDPTLTMGEQGSVPFQVLHAIKVLASFFTMRPASILADVAITPAGGVLTYSQMPAEVRDFIAQWRAGQSMMVSV